MSLLWRRAVPRCQICSEAFEVFGFYDVAIDGFAESFDNCFGLCFVETCVLRSLTTLWVSKSYADHLVERLSHGGV